VINMSTPRSSTGKTYIPDEGNQHQVAELIAEMERQFRAGGSMTLTSASGQVVELPGELFDIVRQVSEILASGRGVTVAPHDTQLTTQEAADFLGISRPTLVKLLTEQRIPYGTVGRHRRVLLKDLVDYQARSRAERQAALRQLARTNQESGMLDLVYRPDEGDT
jgi:excisionase family DNA binding protein